MLTLIDPITLERDQDIIKVYPNIQKEFSMSECSKVTITRHTLAGRQTDRHN